LLLISAGTAFTLLQLVPLPTPIGELLFPAKLALVQDNAAAWGAPTPGWVMASYDPPATLVELAKMCGYLALAWTCVRLASNRQARRWLAVVAAAVPALVAIVTLAHLGTGARKLYGVVDPGFSPRILGPLFGVNHLASLLSIAVPLSLVLALNTRGAARIGWLSAAAAAAGVALLTGSRGGVVGLVAGLVVTITILMIQRRTVATDHRVPLAISLPAGIVAGCTVVLLAIFTAGTVAGELQRTTLDELEDPRSKFQVWGDAMPLVEENRWVGIGRGAFEAAFTPQTPTSFSTYGYVENTYLQVLLDWGLPAAMVLVLLLVAATSAAARRWRKGPIEAAVIGGLVGLAVHELADFSLELPAIAMVVIVAASILFPERLGTATDADGARTRVVAPKVLWMRAGLLASGVLISAVALSPLGHTARADEAEIVSARDASEKIDRARVASARHPADYAILGRAAAAMYDLGDERALPLVRRALARNPRHGAVHYLAARILLSSNAPNNAATEFALAARYSRDPRPIVTDVLGLFESAREAARALPTDLERLELIQRALQARPDVALAHAARATALYPKQPKAHELLATAALAAGDPERAVAAAQTAWQLVPTPPRAQLLGRSLLAAKDVPGAVALLQSAADQLTSAPAAERVPLLITLADALVAADDLAAAKAALETAGTMAESFKNLRIQVHAKMAVLEDKMGNAHQAQWERERARELQTTP
jgi:O-antigen ligase